MMIGVACDPNYPEGTPDLDLLVSVGLRYVRIVSMDNPTVRNFVDQCNQRNLAVWSTIARESNGFIMPGAALHQLGNEPDVNSPSSWSRTPAEYHEDWRIYWGTWFASGQPYEGYPLIMAGLASGLTTWAKQLWALGPLQGCSGYAVHPYAKTPLQARDLINSYKGVFGYNIPAYVDECNFKREDIGYAKQLLQNANVVGMCHYPWNRVMDNSVTGFVDDPVLLRLFCA